MSPSYYNTLKSVLILSPSSYRKKINNSMIFGSYCTMHMHSKVVFCNVQLIELSSLDWRLKLWPEHLNTPLLNFDVCMQASKALARL